MPYYTGIGSRITPNEILNVMSQLGNVFKGTYILRSGGASGADLAFEKYLNEQEADIFLPWKNFNNHKSNLFHIKNEAYDIASRHHKYWQYLKPATKKLMARNVHQVLGIMLDKPSEFLICWTPDGASSSEEITKDTGGTGLAISVASEFNVPVYNLKNKDVLDSISKQYNIII